MFHLFLSYLFFVCFVFVLFLIKKKEEVREAGGRKVGELGRDEGTISKTYCMKNINKNNFNKEQALRGRFVLLRGLIRNCWV